MQFNYVFEIASLALLLIILLHYIFVRQLPIERSRVFTMLLGSVIIECGFNILSSIGLANTEFVPQWGNELFAFVFFALEGITIYLMYRYMLLTCNFDKRQEKMAWLAGFVPLVLFEITVLLNPFMGIYYYFIDNKYYYGFGAGIIYGYVAYYIFILLFLMTRRWDKVVRRTRLVIIAYACLSVLALVMQYLCRDILLTSTGNLIIIFMIYVSLQNPSELVDPITGIGNETALLMRLEQIVSKKEVKDRKDEVSVITLDVKRFHQLNVLFGIENCSELLNEIGLFLHNLAGSFQVFRNNGDTFTVIGRNIGYTAKILQEIEKRFAEDWQIQNNHVVIDVAMVVQHFPRDFSSVTDFLAMREYLMRRAKEQTEDGFLNADEELVKQFKRRSRVELAIRNAVEKRSFEVFFQPIYNLEEKSITTLEALVRMHDEELGYVPPDEFISLAEKDGSILAIGDIVMEECCRFLSKHVLSNTSLGINNIQMNISVAQCMQHDLKDKIVDMLDRYHIPPSMITLEITEGLVINTPTLLQKHMKELGELGIKFAVDDYGSGNANCSYLVKFPFEEVKIDKELTWAYFSSETAKIILQNEIKTMKELGIPLVVEGVETEEQSHEMERLGVEYIQGYFYGKPMPEKECLRYIREFNATREEYGRV